MEYWQTVLQEPLADETMNDFARAIDATPKIVFSRTLNSVDWPTARIASGTLAEEVVALRNSPVSYEKRSNIFVCSPSLIVQLTNLGLIDEYQICIHPVIAAGGLSLFKMVEVRQVLQLVDTKTFTAGAMLLYYKPAIDGGDQI